MHIGIDAQVLTRKGKTGVEKYAFELIRAMMTEPLSENEEVILYASEIPADFPELPKGWRWKILSAPFGRFFTHGSLSLECLHSAPDILFSPANEIPLLTGRAKSIAVIHDLAFRFFPEAYHWKERLRQERALRRAVKKSSAIIAVSQSTANDVLAETHMQKERLHIVHLALPQISKVGSAIFETFQLQPKNYFFTLSRLEKKKNIALLIRAYKQYAQSVENPLDLVLSGKFGFGREEIEQELGNQNAGRIVLTGYVSDIDAHALMRQAHAYVFPSLYEGFGLPVLEAFSFGVPVMCSRIPALQEVAKDGAVYIDVDKEEKWAEGMRRVVQDEAWRKDLVEKGNNRLQDFSWQKTAEQTWKIIRAI